MHDAYDELVERLGVRRRAPAAGKEQLSGPDQRERCRKVVSASDVTRVVVPRSGRR